MLIKEKIEKITNFYREDKEIIDFVNNTLNNMSYYVHSVVEMENLINIQKFRLSPEEFREQLESYDRRRKTSHDAVIIGVKFLNRIYKMIPNTEELFFEGNVEDRYEVANFAKRIVDEIFENRKK